MYGNNVWVSDSVFKRIEKMQSTILRARAADPKVMLVKAPHKNDVIDIALLLLEEEYGLKGKHKKDFLDYE